MLILDQICITLFHPLWTKNSCGVTTKKTTRTAIATSRRTHLGMNAAHLQSAFGIGRVKHVLCPLLSNICNDSNDCSDKRIVTDLILFNRVSSLQINDVIKLSTRISAIENSQPFKRSTQLFSRIPKLFRIPRRKFTECSNASP
jgi:hypothetical protein